MNLQEFLATYTGSYVDYDGVYGAQCADLFNEYTVQVAGGSAWSDHYMGAAELGERRLTFGGVYEWHDPSELGKAGDAISYSGSFGAYLGGGYGHVAILVEDEIAGTGLVRVLSQNPGPATVMTLVTNGCVGYLRPVRNNPIPAKPITGTNQRAVGSSGVNYRKEANSGAEVIQLFNPGDVLDFKGFIHGENVSGNDIWFVGAYTGGFCWSGAFTDTSTNGLPDLTPAPVITVTPASVNSNQKIVGDSGVNYRKEANSGAEVIQLFNPGDVLNVKGYVKGESVSGNSIWFVGALTGGYIWSGGVTDASTNGLPDLTPTPVQAPKPTPAPVTPTPVSTGSTQRVVGDSGAKYRPEPNTKQTEITVFPPASVLNFVGFVRGENISGNDVWFKGINGGYVWSGGVTDPSTTGLSDLNTTTTPVTSAPLPTPVDKPVDNSGTVSPDGLKCVTEWVPAHSDNYEVGNFPGLATTKAVVHQFGVLGIGINSVVSYFQMSLADRIAAELRANPGKTPKVGPTSAHFAVEDERIVQMVKLTNRAYHAGKVGNDYIGIETSPNQSPKTIASVNKLLAELYSKGYRVQLVLHKDVPGNSTECGSLINLNNYHAVPDTTVVTPAPTTVSGVINVPEASVALIQKYLNDIDEIIQSFTK